MKRIKILFLLIGSLAFAENYDELYFKVCEAFGEERISDLNNIYNYAQQEGYELDWETVKQLLETPACL